MAGNTGKILQKAKEWIAGRRLMAFFSPHNRFRWLYDEKLPEKAMTFVRQALYLMLAAGLLTLGALGLYLVFRFVIFIISIF